MKQPIETKTGCRPIGLMEVAGALAGLALMAGCATPTAVPGPTVARYSAPPNVPTAKLVMRGSNLQAGDLYGVFVHDDADNCTGRRIAGAGSNARNPTSVPVAAGSLTTVDFVLIKAPKPEAPNKRDMCMVRWSFTPAAGKSYLVAGNALAAGCSGTVVDATNPDAMRPPAGLVRRNAKENACLPMAKARANAIAANPSSDGDAVLRPNATADDLQGLIGQ